MVAGLIAILLERSDDNSTTNAARIIPPIETRWARSLFISGALPGNHCNISLEGTLKGKVWTLK